jgi:hypothetical protein
MVMLKYLNLSFYYGFAKALYVTNTMKKIMNILFCHLGKRRGCVAAILAAFVKLRYG